MISHLEHLPPVTHLACGLEMAFEYKTCKSVVAVTARGGMCLCVAIELEKLIEVQ